MWMKDVYVPRPNDELRRLRYKKYLKDNFSTLENKEYLGKTMLNNPLFSTLEDNEYLGKTMLNNSDIHEALTDNTLISLIEIILDRKLKLTYTQGCTLKEIEKKKFSLICKDRNVGASTMLIYYAIASILYSRKPINVYLSSIPIANRSIKKQIMMALTDIKERYPYFFKTEIDNKTGLGWNEKMIGFNGSTLTVGDMSDLDYIYRGRNVYTYDCLILDEKNCKDINMEKALLFDKVIICGSDVDNLVRCGFSPIRMRNKNQ